MRIPADPRSKRLPGDISLKHSGTASANYFANSGVHIGDVNLKTGAPVRTRYIEQVRQIAPESLDDRSTELGLLSHFCQDPNPHSKYLYLRAGPWTGKTALLSWFTLNPPATTRIVSFFITARLASQDSRPAFIDHVLEQLATILDEPLPALLNENTREAHLLGMLAEAAGLCGRRGETLCLVVDGLDEDRGYQSAIRSHSIAAMLPVKPPENLRIIVAGRPNPPIPIDVDEHHPLRNHHSYIDLKPSPKAEIARNEMANDLNRLAAGNSSERSLIGFLCATRGGLTIRDLEYLASTPAAEIDGILTNVTGRSFSRRPGFWRPESIFDVYLLGHEELQRTAELLLESSLKDFKSRIHSWYSEYKELEWPVNTPEFLLRGYFDMVIHDQDLRRAVDIVTDEKRHECMLNASGGDSAAVRELTTVHDKLLNSGNIDLLAMARVAVHRDYLRERSRQLPSNLPGVWARIGAPNRAESLLESIQPDAADAARLHLIEALLERIYEAGADNFASDPGEFDYGSSGLILDRVELLADQVDASALQIHALLTIARGAGVSGDRHRAHRLLDRVGKNLERARRGIRTRGYTEIAYTYIGMGDISSALRAIELVENRNRQAWLRKALIVLQCRNDGFDSVVEQVRLITDDLTVGAIAEGALYEAAMSQGLQFAIRLLGELSLAHVSSAHVSILHGSIRRGDTDETKSILSFASNANFTAGELACFASTAARRNWRHLAVGFVELARSAALVTSDSCVRDSCYAETALALELLEDDQAASETLGLIAHSAGRDRAFRDVAILLGRRGESLLAVAQAKLIEDDVRRLHAQCDVAEELLNANRHAEAKRLLRLIAAQISSISSPFAQDAARQRVAVVVGAFDKKLAWRMFASLTDSRDRAIVVEGCATRCAAAGKSLEAIEWASASNDGETRALLLARLADMAAAGSDRATAISFAEKLEAEIREDSANTRAIKILTDLATVSIIYGDQAGAQAAAAKLINNFALSDPLQPFYETSNTSSSSSEAIERYSAKFRPKDQFKSVVNAISRGGFTDGAIHLLVSQGEHRAADLLRIFSKSGHEQVALDHLDEIMGASSLSDYLVLWMLADVISTANVATARDIVASLPAEPETAFSRGIIDVLAHGGDTARIRALSEELPENERLYYGGLDRLPTALADTQNFDQAEAVLTLLPIYGSELRSGDLVLIAHFVATGQLRRAYRLAESPSSSHQRLESLLDSDSTEKILDLAHELLPKEPQRPTSIAGHGIVVMAFEVALQMLRLGQVEKLRAFIAVIDHTDSNSWKFGHKIAELTIGLACAGDFDRALLAMSCITEIEHKMQAVERMAKNLLSRGRVDLLDVLTASVEPRDLNMWLLSQIPLPAADLAGFVEDSLDESENRFHWGSSVVAAAAVNHALNGADQDAIDVAASVHDASEQIGIWWAVLECSSGDNLSPIGKRALCELLRLCRWIDVCDLLRRRAPKALAAGVSELSHLATP